MSRLIIGTVTAFLTPDEITITPDDRQEKVNTTTYSGGAFMPSVSVIDGGMCESGQVGSISGAKFRAADWATIYGYWENRTPVTVSFTDTTWTNCRIKLTRWTQSKKFGSVTTADIEIWRV